MKGSDGRSPSRAITCGCGSQMTSGRDDVAVTWQNSRGNVSANTTLAYFFPGVEDLLNRSIPLKYDFMF